MNNGSTDKTTNVVLGMQKKFKNIFLIETSDSGKGLAIAIGFKDALTRSYDLIGFVDADMSNILRQHIMILLPILMDTMALLPVGICREPLCIPARPWIKRWGSKLIFESLTRSMFGIHYYDTQCGAKLFTYQVIQRIAPFLTVKQWAFDIELLYLCKRFNFRVKEYPTQWYDQTGSKLRIFSAGLRMIATLFSLRWYYLHKVLFFLFFISMFK